MNGYNRLAPFYDRLATVFVGKQLQQAQLALLPYLQQKRKLLILGGGTGWILSHIFKINPTLEIDYVDSAAQMIARARQRAGLLPVESKSTRSRFIRTVAFQFKIK
ncbi:MAG: class I SAM-dependent methyltransferase [Cytophagales bacterium]|nr:class I SAM-dependent methyltransferase [Cytophagales bacterium]